MEKAQELLIHTQKKIKEIAFLVGYKDELYFSKVFARLYGIIKDLVSFLAGGRGKILFSAPGGARH